MTKALIQINFAAMPEPYAAEVQPLFRPEAPVLAVEWLGDPAGDDGGFYAFTSVLGSALAGSGRLLWRGDTPPRGQYLVASATWWSKDRFIATDDPCAAVDFEDATGWTFTGTEMFVTAATTPTASAREVRAIGRMLWNAKRPLDDNLFNLLKAHVVSAADGTIACIQYATRSWPTAFRARLRTACGAAGYALEERTHP